MSHYMHGPQREKVTRANGMLLLKSDGESLGDHGLLEKGCRFYDGLVRVPLIFSWPGRVQENLQSPALVELLDKTATIVDLAELPQPDYMQGRSLLPVMPGDDTFPYTVRVVSDILESNGSSSMASVCGATLALMDAGVPLTAPVAGVAMGLILDPSTGRHAVLSDIAGAEDHYGDMDFKVAGTRAGITALQMDIKVGGITADIMRQAMEQARTGRLHILERMRATLQESRSNISSYAPRIVTIQIPIDKIRDVIGPGGKTIRSIIERTGVKIDVEDDGRVNVASRDDASAQKAISIIEELTATPELNKTYLGKVQRITDFGAFVEVLPGLDGLLHISEIAHYRVKEVRDELQEGEQVLVKVINVDPSGKIRLSRKALLDKPEGRGQPPSCARPER
ncbi:MAG: S1 RNA-binding domain-containing protein, partial [Acidobacteria bacterium]|nr:S1 RNA-binding domain-containing protein [Acidobacteriota bacterium]